MTKAKLEVFPCRVVNKGRRYWWILRLPKRDAAEDIPSNRDYPTKYEAKRSARRWAERHRFEIVEVVKG